MKVSKGFTLVELIVVVAIAGILAAVVIPALITGRVAANESATLGDIRTIISAQTAYRSANAGFYDAALSCLLSPSNGCIPSYPTNAPTFLDSALASLNPKTGYHRVFSTSGMIVPPPTASLTSTNLYRYDATPVNVGVTGVRGFAGDNTGRVCATPDGTAVPAGPFGGTIPANCQNVR
jgi:prepilin-type N-terminal cleavage/methylation domain-containing protein